MSRETFKEMMFAALKADRWIFDVSRLFKSDCGQEVVDLIEAFLELMASYWEVDIQGFYDILAKYSETIGEYPNYRGMIDAMWEYIQNNTKRKEE